MADKKNAAVQTKKNNLPMIIGAVALIAILVLGKSVLGRGNPEDKEKKKEKAEIGISMPLEEFMVNLNGGGEHYLRTTIALGLKKGVTEEQMKEHIPPMRDAILSILSSKTLSDLDKTKGREHIKSEIKEKVNDAVENEPVVKVYFTTFATQ